MSPCPCLEYHAECKKTDSSVPILTLNKTALWHSGNCIFSRILRRDQVLLGPDPSQHISQTGSLICRSHFSPLQENGTTSALIPSPSINKEGILQVSWLCTKSEAALLQLYQSPLSRE